MSINELYRAVNKNIERDIKKRKKNVDKQLNKLLYSKTFKIPKTTSKQRVKIGDGIDDDFSFLPKIFKKNNKVKKNDELIDIPKSDKLPSCKVVKSSVNSMTNIQKALDILNNSASKEKSNIKKVIDILSNTDFRKESETDIEKLNEVLDKKLRNGRIYPTNYIQDIVNNKIKRGITKADLVNYILYNNKPVSEDDFSVSGKTINISKKGVVCNFQNLHDYHFIATEYCTFITGDRCSFMTGKCCKFIIGDDCDFLFNDKRDCIIIGNYNRVLNTNHIADLGFNFDTVQTCIEIS